MELADRARKRETQQVEHRGRARFSFCLPSSVYPPGSALSVDPRLESKLLDPPLIALANATFHAEPIDRQLLVSRQGVVRKLVLQSFPRLHLLKDRLMQILELSGMNCAYEIAMIESTPGREAFRIRLAS